MHQIDNIPIFTGMLNDTKLARARRKQILIAKGLSQIKSEGMDGHM